MLEENRSKLNRMWYINMQIKTQENITSIKHIANSIYDTRKKKALSPNSTKKCGTRSVQPGSKPPKEDSSKH